VKKVVRILAVAAVATATYAAYSTPLTNASVKKGTTLSEGAAPRPECPVSLCGPDSPAVR
jgi:hypothetical protein